MKVLDCSANNGDLTAGDLAAFAPELVILDLTDPAWCSRNLRIVNDHGLASGFYSSDRGGAAMTWPMTTDTLGALGVNPLAHPIGVDWWEFAQKHMGPEAAAEYTVHGIHLAHDDGIRVGPYAAEFFGWPYLDHAGVSSIADWFWVANPRTPRHRTDLHQYGGRITVGDFNETHLTLSEFLALTTGPYGQEDDMTPEQAGQLAKVYAYVDQIEQKGVAPSDLAGDVAYQTGFRFGLRRVALPVRFQGNVDAELGWKMGTATPVP